MTDTSSGPASRPESLRLLEHEIGVMIRRIRRVIGLRARAVHADLQPASYLMLAHVAESGPLRSSAMAETFDVDKGAISRQVQHLVDLGLVARTPDPEDGRASLVSATDDAVRRLADVAAQRREWLDERLGGWSEDELTAFVADLGRYNAALE
ncbi:MAG TPA: MarR family transcriptional regulator [Nocardioides sp.]|nr:MarR family transcriptional regulator [Nocardioides sp.]